MAPPTTFSVLHDPAATTTVADREANLTFRAQATKLSREVSSAIDAANTAKTKIDAIIRVLDQMPQAPAALGQRARSINQRVVASLRALRGDNINSARGEQVPVSIQGHAGNASPDGMLAPPTSTNREQYDIALSEFTAEYAKLKPLLTTELPELEQELTRIGALPTPGRIPPQL